MEGPAPPGSTSNLPAHYDPAIPTLPTAAADCATVAVTENATHLEVPVISSAFLPTTIQHAPRHVTQTEEPETVCAETDSDVGSQRASTPSSLPGLMTPSSSEDNTESDQHYPASEQCPGCSGPQHSNTDECPVWRLAPRSAQESDFDTTEVATAANSTFTTPRVAQLQLGFTPILDPPASSFEMLPMHRFQSPRDDILVHNLQQILGLDPERPENLAKLRDLAHAAEMQAHEAYEQFSRRLAERSEQFVHGMPTRGSSPPYVDQPEFIRRMTDSLLTNRSAFSLKMGMQWEEEEHRTQETADIATTDHLTTHTLVSKAPIRHIDLSIRDDSETIPTPMLSEFDTPLSSLSSSSPEGPVTERSAEYDFDYYDPQDIIDDAVSRVIAQTPGIILYHSPTTTFSSAPATPPPASNDDTDSVDTADFDAQISAATGYLPDFQPRDDSNRTLGEDIYSWVEHQMERQDHTRRWDMDFGGEPWHDARSTAYGPLHSFLDHPRMAAENLRELSRDVAAYTSKFGAFPISSSRPMTPVSDTVPHGNQSPTSLDFSLPREDQVPSSLPPMSNSVDDDAIAGAGTADDRGEKRKVATSRSPSPAKPRKRFRKLNGDSLRRKAIHIAAIKATRLVKPGIIEQLAVVRRGMLEGSRRIEDILVRENVRV
ncbi:hypothetical protein FB451DRAFT_1431780 [Mycena latifolia]|nr:hypothetical protein FB451DRAFT_1431780 [Mycena latifolia]